MLPQDEIVLVTPVWNDSSRLENYGLELAEALSDFPHPVRWIIADDGSGGDEPSRLNTLAERFGKIFPHVEVHIAARHLGKGGVVREAWSRGPDARWLAFVDADGAVSAADLLGLIGKAMAHDKSVLGIRKQTESTRLVESPWRKLTHHAFLTAVRLVLGLRCEDPQCGSKVLRGVDYRRVADRLVENGLAFDSEMLFALHRDGSDWLEVPVNWEEKGNGKVKPLQDGCKMLAALFRIRLAATFR